MTLSEAKAEILAIVKDHSDYVLDNLTNFVNEALAAIANETEIPDLKLLTSVSTVEDQAWVNMPTGFDGRLLYAGNSNGQITIHPEGMRGLILNDPGLDRSGSVDMVALEGSILYYQGIPAETETLTILIYQKPTLLTSDDDVIPTYIPMHLQRGLLSHRAAAVVYDKIEDEFEGTKPNVNAQMALYEGWKIKFQQHLSRRRRSYAKSVWSA